MTPQETRALIAEMRLLAHDMIQLGLWGSAKLYELADKLESIYG